MVQPLPIVANNNLLAPNAGDNPQPGSPTIAPLALSQTANTSVANSNNNLVHVCDITGNLQYAVAWASLQIKELVQAVKNAVAALWQASVSSPFGDQIRNVIQTIQQKVSQIQQLIAKAKEVQAVITSYIQQLEQLIAYIASLPARIAQLLSGCLNSAQNSLASTIANASTITTASASTTLTAVSNQLTTVSNAPIASSSGPALQKP